MDLLEPHVSSVKVQNRIVWKSYGNFLYTPNIHLPCDWVIPLLGIFQREWNTYLQKTCTRMLTSSYILNRLKLETARWGSTREQQTSWYIIHWNTTKQQKRIKLLTYITTWMNLKIIMLYKQKHYVKKANTIWFYLNKVLVEIQLIYRRKTQNSDLQDSLRRDMKEIPREMTMFYILIHSRLHRYIIITQWIYIKISAFHCSTFYIKRKLFRNTEFWLRLCMLLDG